MPDPRTTERVWIIGASDGIGAALARAYAARGDRVILSARSTDRLQALAGEMPKGAAEVVGIDIADAADVADAALRVKAGGPVDRVINMAALYDPGQVEEIDLTQAANIVQVNLTGSLLVARAALDVLRPQGQIALCGSVAGYFGLPQGQIYSATKAGVANLAETLRNEVAGRFDVRLISPGFVDTRLTQKNDFTMPGLLTADRAAAEILQGLDARRFEVHFPRRLTMPLKLLRRLPYALSLPLTRRLVR
ncbi:SDR family NAD(P)-dependent oxidoreductase [Thalassovita mediterranea]|jgi:short-subunit dehydrogenase|uniref:Putative oxidoreductase n=1 Tax=Thalassovita mediterranea TaxID=340021 RepID=A0A0P1GTB3_9RHOB|nr:SDR family NAD(P)-dependent oxidoreductase [Thalassovita mediterranea]CUH85916.1 putative oxidoreductase [Thalassovita mediterranea]SIS32807.1 Short-chain dehydrogenase [Thalassovita mediterranea]